MPQDEVKVDDLTELWNAGAVQLPAVAVQYAALAQALHRTALPQDAAFRRSIGGGSRLPTAWTSLRNLVQDEIAVRSHENLVKAGEALTKIADSYATTDFLNEAQIRAYETEIEGIGNGVVRLDDGTERERTPPPDVPDAPSSSDPHPQQRPPSQRGEMVPV